MEVLLWPLGPTQSLLAAYLIVLAKYILVENKTILAMQTLPLSSQNQKPLPSSLYGGAELSTGRHGTGFIEKIIPRNPHVVKP